MTIKIKQNNVLVDVKTYQDCTFNHVFGDPPYNLSSKWEICPTSGRYIMKKSSDFMNKWEGLNHDDIEMLFKEFFRILKFGGFCILFGLQRQTQPFYYYASKAGFDIIEPMYWGTMANFPKATDVSLFVDKKQNTDREIIGTSFKHDITGNALMERTDPDKRKENSIKIVNRTKSTSELGKEFEGYKYSQCPMKKIFEVIMVFRKASKESVIGDIIKNDPNTSPSCFNIDAGRIPMSEEERFQNIQGKRDTAAVMNESSCGLNKEGLVIESHPLGRYPSQLFLDRDLTDNLSEQAELEKLVHVCEDGEVFFEPTVSQDERNAGLGDEFKEQPTECLAGNKDGSINKHSGPTVCKNPHPTLKPISLIYRLGKLLKLPDRFNQQIYVPFCGTFSEIIGLMKAKIPNIVGCEMNK